MLLHLLHLGVQAHINYSLIFPAKIFYLGKFLLKILDPGLLLSTGLKKENIVKILRY